MGGPKQDALPIVIEPMRIRDVGAVLEVEKLSFTTPWSRAAFMSELLNNERAFYLVARNTARRGPLPWNTGQVIGYIGVWLIYDEGHITNVAVHPDYRQQGIGRRLMEAIEAVCVTKGVKRMTLEVRVSNLVAQRLYRDLGYISVGVRPGYYQDNNEDALIMWKEL